MSIIASKIATVRRKNYLVSAMTGSLAAIGAAVLCLAAGMLLDWWLNFSLVTRTVLLALDLAVVVWLLLYGFGRPLVYGPDDDDIALMVENEFPAFRTRLIASVQLSRDGAVPAGGSMQLVRATIAQAEALSGPMDFTSVVKTDLLTRIAVVSLTSLVLGIAALAWSGEWGMDLLKRAFLANIPVPRQTRVLPITDHLISPRGDNVEILALADGTVPEFGELHVKTTVGGNKQVFQMTRVQVTPQRIEEFKQSLARSKRDQATIRKTLQRLESQKDAAPVFMATLENVQESFTYLVKLNDGESVERYTVEVMPRPAITRIEVRQVYPAYTGRTVEPRALGDLSILQGSKLQLTVTTNKNLRRPSPLDTVPNFVHLIGSDKDFPLAVQADARMLAGEIDLPATTNGFAINLTDDYGLKSKDPTVYRIDLVPDKVPTCRIIQPSRREVLLVREARLKVIFEAMDDYAVGKVAICYKVDGGEDQRVALDLKGNKPKAFRGEHTWKLAEIKPSEAHPNLEGSTIEYWVEVEDTNDVSGPGKGFSEHYMIRVVTEAEKRAEMAARIAEIGSNLKTATDDQEGLANKVQTIVLERENGTTPGGLK